MTETELRQHLRAVHFMGGIGAGWPTERMQRAHTFAHCQVARQDHQHT